LNAVEIEEAISALAGQPFDAQEFPFAFLEAFGNKPTTIKRLRSGASNKSDLGGVLQTSNIHIAACPPGEVTKTLAALKASRATAKAKARFVLATDGEFLEAEDLTTDDAPIACAYRDFPDHFGFFLPLAGITTVKQIRESSFDIRATSRLNRLYVELLRDNPEWGTAERRHDMNHFMARLIFCFFAEDTDIFKGVGLFTATIEQMSARDSSNTHDVISELFRAMDTRIEDRATAKVPRWADAFPYVNGGLFSGNMDVPRFSRIARSYLLHIGNLDWTKINPDIFGSMIQAVAEDEERGALGMHYTSVPNILKVLNPLFLDDLRNRLDEADDNTRVLLNLRRRISKIRVFDPACGSGNFLVIAYKEMRSIEAEINRRRGEADRRTAIPLTNFRGIELRSFPAEIARLALIIAEFQSDVLYRGQKEALAEFLPLDAENWITCGNALTLDWFSICPPTGTGVKFHAEDLFGTALDQAQIDFENEGGETYICGNPPYIWGNEQTAEQKVDLKTAFAGRLKSLGSIDYVAGWFIKARDYFSIVSGRAAFVATNSLNQGRQVPLLWPILLDGDFAIQFAHLSFKWSNLATKNAGVTVSVIGYGKSYSGARAIFADDTKRETSNISPYLVSGPTIFVHPQSSAISCVAEMNFGSMPNDGGGLLLTREEAASAISNFGVDAQLIRPLVGSEELIHGIPRYCIWVRDDQYLTVRRNPWLASRFKIVETARKRSTRLATSRLANVPFRFAEVRQSGGEVTIAVPAISSENRDYLPFGLIPNGAIITNRNYGIFDAPLWNAALIASRLHWVWMGTICGRLELRFSYTNTLGWNTFPVPTLTEKNKADLTWCAEDILLAREAHFPATIADLYDPENMPADLREAHERNDEVFERIYIGRRFRNDTERLEKLFELYTKMTAEQGTVKKRRARVRG
jgi:hypothetical protein